MSKALSVCGKPVTTMTDAARQLGWNVITVRDLIRTNGIKTYRVRHSPSGRGIDADGMTRLRQCAGRKTPNKGNAVSV